MSDQQQYVRVAGYPLSKGIHAQAEEAAGVAYTEALNAGMSHEQASEVYSRTYAKRVERGSREGFEL